MFSQRDFDAKAVPWTKEDLDTMMEMIAEGFHFGQVGRVLGRSPYACRAKFRYESLNAFGLWRCK